MHLSPAEDLPSPRGLASGKTYAYFSSEFEFLDLKNLYFDIQQDIYWKIMHLTPAGHRPSPLGLASDQSNAYFSSEFEFLDLKNL